MSVLQLAAVALLATQASGLAVQERSSMQLEHVVQSMPMYAKDCWQKRAVVLAQNPGAGIDKFTPFTTVLKDGYLEADCVKDYMYSFGDKFGDNKFSYKLEKTAGVSIVHYDDHVAKEDRKAITPKVCFEFCRTVPEMGFFGIVNGRDCYCTPYYKPMESGSSNCDAVCEGDPTLMCGGKSKSTVFSMHMCANTAADLTAAGTKASSVEAAMMAEVTIVKGLSTDMQASADKLQTSFGAVGDSATTNLLQSAKVFAGDLLHTAEDAEKVAKALKDLSDKAAVPMGSTTDPKEVAAAEGVVEDIDKTLTKGDKATAELDEVKNLAMVAKPADHKDASKQYYPVMYFIDQAQKDAPQTCGGDVVAKPITGGDLDGCAAACDKLGSNSCVGFSHYAPAGKESLCFLFSKFKTAFYFTGCGAFLQSKEKAAPFEVKCMAKFSEFEGTTLKPDGSGKCKQCLKKLTKADRCFA